ncbi:DUF643 domain-containing protein [Borreliella bavariensis]|uniref:DUF643 domain-containing protein n=2 Tax=Borreliella bavariensis TaxID=664662 RepID=UPI001C000505|nr:DUF643 domain-containing protein [Borreliella bavariensis]
MFLLYYYIDNMHANKVSDFYDNLDKKTKKEIDKLYRTDQATLEQKRQIYSAYELIQEYKRKTGKSIYEVINDTLGPEKEFIKEVLKDKYLIKKHSSKNIKVDFSYKEEMLEECLDRLGEDKSINFLLFVHRILQNINQKISKQKRIYMIIEFAYFLFINIHYYDKKIFTSKNLINAVKGFSKIIE